jgi:hypothetical protein
LTLLKEMHTIGGAERGLKNWRFILHFSFFILHFKLVQCANVSNVFPNY